MSVEIKLTDKSYKQLKKLYLDAVEKGLPVLMYEGMELVTGFVKYVLEYYELQNPKR